jgi:hypothetical protein
MDFEVKLPTWFAEFKKIPMFKDAIIAGGYLRNQWYGLKPKDVDIFFPITSDRDYYKDINNAWPKLQAMGFTQEGTAKIYNKANLTSQMNLKIGGEDVS